MFPSRSEAEAKSTKLKNILHQTQKTLHQTFKILHQIIKILHQTFFSSPNLKNFTQK